MHRINLSVYEMSEEKQAISEIKLTLQKKLGIYPQLLNHHINNKRKEVPLAITRDDAIVLLALEQNIAIDSIGKEKIKEINDLIIKIKQLDSYHEKSDIITKPKIVVSKSNKRKSTKKPITLIFSDFKLENSQLPLEKITEAKEMSEFYAYIYLFENSVRFLISSVLEKKIGKDWWDKDVISNRIRNEVDRIKTMRKKKWILHEAHPIFYTTMGQLVNIVEKNLTDFDHIFGDIQKLKSLIEPVEEARNPIAHNNALSKNRRDLLKLNIKLWFEHLDNIKVDT